jgi:drug/metabolite transporter (DMT)-like permease
MQKELLGIIYKILSMFGYSTIAVINKGSISSLNIFQTFFLSSLSCLVFIIAIIKLSRKESLPLIKSLDRGYILISAMNMIGVCSVVYAIRTLDITTAISIGYLTPILTSVFALWILKEQLYFKVIIALAMSILGAVIIAKPMVTNASTTLGIVSAFVSAIVWSIHNLMLKKQAMKDHWAKQTFLTLICTTSMSLPIALFNWSPLAGPQILIFILLGILYTISKMFLVKGLNRTPLLLLVPIGLIKLTFNATLVYFFFNEVTTVEAIIGNLLIVLATVIVMYSTKTIASTNQAR